MKDYSLLLFVFIMMVSCNEPSTPEINESSIVDILSDMRIAKSASEKYPISQRDSIRTYLEEEIYTIYNIDSVDYNSILDRLTVDSKLFYSIEKSVQDRIDSLMKVYSIK